MKHNFKTNISKAARFIAVGIVLFSVLFFFSDILNLFKIQPAQAATLQYVGGAESSGNSASFNVSLTSLTGGIGSVAIAGDLVIIATGFVQTSNLNPGVSTAGYTEVADLYQNDSRDANFSVNWKIMGGTPDTTVSCNGSGSASNGAVCIVHVWRNADQTTPMDVAVTTAISNNSAVPNSPAITPITSGAIVIATGLGTGLAADTSVTAPAGYGNQVDISVDPGNAATTGISSKIWSGSGAEDPAVWTNWTTSTSDSWAAVTLAIRPANDPPVLVIDNPPAGNTNVAEGANYSIQYDLSDGDSVANVDFYYDTNNDGVGGTAIAACQNQTEGTNATCSFSTSILSVSTAYYIYGVASDGVNPNVTTVSSGTITVNARPTLTVSQPDGSGDTVTVGDLYNITYSLADTDNVVTAAMYYDTDAAGLNGTAITGACATAGEGSTTCSWNTTGMTPGSYYVYGITNDGVNPQVSDYSPGQITINSPNSPPTLTITQPDGVSDTIAQDGSYNITYTLSDTDNVVTAAMYYDTDAAGLNGTAIGTCSAVPEGTGATCSWNTTGVTPGNYYIYGITNDGVNPAVNDYSPGTVTINARPTLTVSQPDGSGDTVTVGDLYNITYSLADTDNVVTAAMYYDTDAAGLNGTAIAGACATAGEGSTTCSWNTTGMTPGSYYVYGITNDGVNPQVSDYSPGQITINAALTSTLGTGSDPAVNTIAPGEVAATDVNRFTLQTSGGTETITSVTVNLSTNSGVGVLAITDNSNNVLGSTSSPVTGSNAISVSGMSATTTLTTFKVRATPLSHAAMPPPDGGAYAITAPVTSWAGTGGYSHAGSDTNPNALTIDNDSPAGTTGLAATSGENGQSVISWTNPADTDFQQVYIYCKTSSLLSGEAPAEGTDPAAGSTCDGTARLRYKGTASPQTITGLTNSQIYYFRVYARDTRGNFTAYSATQQVSATPSAPNTPPTLTVSQPDGSGDTVTVGDSYNITYNLSDPEQTVTVDFWYDTDAAGLNGTAITGCQNQPEGAPATCSWDTTGMTPGSYYVYGRDVNDGIAGEVSDYSPGPITINAALPGAPGTPTFSNIGATSLRVNWTAAGGAVSYKIERCSGSGCVNFSQIASGVTTLYYDDSPLSANTVYRYQIRATNAGGDGPYSGIGTTLTLPAAPGTPTFSNVGETSLRVEWIAPTGGAVSYKVERCQGSGCTGFSEISSGVAVLYYDDSPLSPNTTYRYQVRATNASGDGAYSGIGSVTTSATPVITVGADGTQTSSLIIPSSDNYVGGAFTFSRSAGSTDVTQITITETGSVDANANLSNVKIYYETTDTCSYGGSETLFGTGSFDTSSKSAITGTITVGSSQICVYIILDVGSGATGGDTMEIEITNPSTEVVAAAGNVAPSSAVAISGTTTLNTIPVITAAAAGSQISPFIIPSTNNYVGGAFTFQRSAGSTTVTQITITETGSVNAQTNLSNIKLYYETADTCSYGGGESQFGTAVAFNGSAKATFTGSITVGTSKVCVYVVLDVGSGASDGQTLEIEITNPSTEVVAAAGNMAPATPVVISGTTTLLIKPVVTSVSPDNGKLAGGTNITITGTGFLSGASVTFGGSAAADISVVSDTSITAATPAHSAGAVDIVVTNTNGQSGTLAGGYTYNPFPTVSGVDPAAGPIGGNTNITITGTGFLSGASVTFGGSAAADISVISGTSITAKTPAHSAGAVDVVVTNADTQSGTLVNGFSYTAGPVITSISPDNGKLAGGTNVTITGGNFQSGATINFSGDPATNVVFVSSTTITATTPAHSAGAVNVTVTNPDMQSHTLTGGYAYNPFPTVSSVSPSSGSTGGDNITITGTGFLSGASVTFGGSAAANIVVVSGTSITALTPAHAIGTVDVIITNADTQSGTLINGFSYVGPPVVNLTANPASIYSGELSVLNWTSTDASSCTASGAWSGNKATTGNEIVSPTSTSTYTLTCDGPGGSSQSSVTVTVSGEAPPPSAVGGAAGVQFYFGGFAYANGTVLIYDNGIPVARLTTGDDGSFSTILRVYTTLKHVYGIVAYDKEKQSSPVKTFPSDIYVSRAAGEILMAPTINLSKRKVSKNEEINIYGYATPRKKVKIEIDGKTEADIASGETGYYNANISAAKFSDGSHKIRVKQIDEANKESDYSILKLITIGEIFAANTDLNGDNILNITDWSIFLSSWASKKTEIRAKIDLNGDGKINISDLSIFLSAFSKKKR